MESNDSRKVLPFQQPPEVPMFREKERHSVRDGVTGQNRRTELSESGSRVDTAETVEDEGRPTQTADNFETQPVHEAPEDAVLATEVASVQKQEDPVPGTEEVRSTDGREGVPAPVDTPVGSQVQSAEGTHNHAETERNTAPLSSQSSPASTAARRMSATRPVRD
jgi:hypothetical protein